MFMQSKPTISCVVSAMLLAALASSCAHLPFVGERFQSDDSSMDDPPEQFNEVVSVDDEEAALIQMVTNSVDRANAAHNASRSELVRRNPYFFKQYEYYPDGTTLMEVEIRETESRTAPKIGEVQLRKQRFVTQLHRKKDEARSDDDFLRDTGDEILTYELRNGRWKRVSSLFVAESVERNVDGVWMPVVEVEGADDSGEEEDLGWFGRIWANVVGR